MEVRFRIVDGRPVLVGVSPGGKSPPPDPKVPRYVVSYADLLKAVENGEPIPLTPADDQES